MQFDLPPGTHNLTLALGQYKAVAHQVDYTLKVFSTVAFGLKKLPYSMRHVEGTRGAWRGATAGGCPNHDTYVDNARYCLELEQTADVQLELAGPAAHPVGLEVTPLRPADGAPGAPPPKAVASTASYRKGFCVQEARGLPAGRYAVVPSTYAPGQEGGFTLVVGSSAPCALRELRPEGHGLHRLLVRGEWSAAAGSAAGSPNERAFHRNPHLRLVVSRRAELSLRLRCAAATRASHRPSLSADLYHRAGRLAAGDAEFGRAKPLASSNGGVYGYPPGGVLVPRRHIDAGTYVLVLSTFEPRDCAYELELYSTEGAVRAEALS